MHACTGKQRIDLDNSLSCDRHQYIYQTHFGHCQLGTEIMKIGIKTSQIIHSKTYLQKLPVKWQPFVLAAMC